MDAVPNCDHAIVDPVKISDYLLSETHPVGRSKARFFRRFGFGEDAPEELTQALLAHVRDCPLATIEVSPYGTKYRVEGRLISPDGRNPLVTTVWIIVGGEIIPRFVTAFPC
ncbi:MAG TPA: hypothetical protein VH913_20515 [Hyphomicrobiaceae bacterium]